MPVVTAAEWDQFLQQYPDAHILQTRAWGILKQSFGWHADHLITTDIEGTIGALVLSRRILPGFSISYIPKGPVVSKGSKMSGSTWDHFIREVDSLCRARRSILLKIEPDIWQESKPGEAGSREDWDSSQDGPATICIPEGFVPATHTIQPPRTIVMDISQSSEEAILGRMKQKTRYNIRLAQKKGVRVTASDDLHGFYQLMTTTGERDDFGVHSFEYFEKAYQLFKPDNQVELLLATYEDQILAGLMVFRSGHRAWYFYGASSNDRRDLMPAYLLQWEAILWAKRYGCTEYDLWGVPDADFDELEAHFSDRSEGLWGVYRFKRGFGGELRHAGGPWDRIYQPILYRLYRWRTGKSSE